MLDGIPTQSGRNLVGLHGKDGPKFREAEGPGARVRRQLEDIIPWGRHRIGRERDANAEGHEPRLQGL
eukprot:8994083-Pyramimonas_sp.AAC.1